MTKPLPAVYLGNRVHVESYHPGHYDERVGDNHGLVCSFPSWHGRRLHVIQSPHTVQYTWL